VLHQCASTWDSPVQIFKYCDLIYERNKDDVDERFESNKLSNVASVAN